MDQITEIISSKYDNIVELEDSVVKSIKLAEAAENSAQEAADYAVHWYGGRKEAIELLQNASEFSSKALISLAEAQKKSFEYQTKLTEITKFLFGLGVSSIAMNRCVVRELELKLKGASEEDISDLAKQELKNVILQLKAQEDMMKKQELLTAKLKEQNGQLKEINRQLDGIEEIDEEQDERIAENAEKITRHSRVLSAQQQKDEEHDKRIAENAQDIDCLEKQDEEQDKLIAVGIKKDEEHDKLIAVGVKKDEEHDKLIAVGIKKDKEHDEKILENAQDIDELERQDQEQDKKIADLQDAIAKNADELHESNGYYEKKLENVLTEFNATVSELKEELEAQKTETSNKIKALEDRVNSLDAAMSKKTWKITVSIVAGISLLLNILQILAYVFLV